MDRKPNQSKKECGLKKPYQAPALNELGDFQDLTLSKGGTKGDGGSKPNTRLSGGVV